MTGKFLILLLFLVGAIASISTTHREKGLKLMGTCIIGYVIAEYFPIIYTHLDKVVKWNWLDKGQAI